MRLNISRPVLAWDHEIEIQGTVFAMRSPHEIELPDMAQAFGTIDGMRASMAMILREGDGWVIAKMREGELREALNAYAGLVTSHYQTTQAMIRHAHASQLAQVAQRAAAAQAPGNGQQAASDKPAQPPARGGNGAPQAPRPRTTADGTPIDSAAHDSLGGVPVV